MNIFRTNASRPLINIGGRETDQFCVARACNDYDYDNGYQWDYQVYSLASILVHCTVWLSLLLLVRGLRV